MSACRHSQRRSHTIRKMSACWLCRHESNACVNLVCVGLVCADPQMSAMSAMPTAVNCNTHIRYNICYYISIFFQISKIHYQHDQHTAVAIGEPHQTRMT
jgi:hypothetical protein